MPRLLGARNAGPVWPLRFLQGMGPSFQDYEKVTAVRIGRNDHTDLICSIASQVATLRPGIQTQVSASPFLICERLSLRSGRVRYWCYSESTVPARFVSGAQSPDMDEIPKANHIDALASAYLRQLRQQQRDKVQKPSLQAWLELEQRILLGPQAKDRERLTPIRTVATVKKNKKPQSIWKRPISELWR